MLRLLAGAALAAGPAALQAQRLGGAQEPDISIGRVLAALVVCLAAAFALALAIRGRKGSLPWRGTGWLRRTVAGPRRIDVIEARRLSIQAELCLVRCDGREYLLLCGASGAQVLRHSALGEGADAQ